MSACLSHRFLYPYRIQVNVFCLANPNKIVNYVLIVRCSVHVAHDIIRYQYNLLYILLFIINSKGMLTCGINVPVCARVCNYINQLHTCNRIAVCCRLLSARKSLKIWSEFLKSIPPLSKKIRFLFAPTLVKLLYNPQITDICVVFLILCRSYVDF